MGLHHHAPGHQLDPRKHRGDPIEHVVARFLDVVGGEIFERQHSSDVQVAGAGDQVLLVGIFARKLKADQVAAVIQILSVYKVVLRDFPARWLYLTN